MQIHKCFFFISAEIQSYDHWFELWCANGKSTLINAHTANNKEDFQFVPSDIEPKVDGKIKYCYGRTKQLKKSECLTFNDWLQVSQNFSNLIFAMSRENVLTKRGYGYICFPPEYSDVLTREVRDTLNKLSSGLTGVIVCNYDIAANFRLLNMDVEELTNSIKVKKIPSYENRFLWFHPDGIIVNVRVSAQEDAKSIEEELIKCRDDLKLFYLMNNSIFKSAGICITFLLILLTANEESIRTACQICTYNLVTIKNTKDGLSKFLERIKKEKRETAVDPSSEKTVKIFKTIISQVVASMAGSKCKSQCFLPVLGGNPQDRLSSLMLNPGQVSVLNSSCNVKIIKGVYGSGKSIVGRVLFECHADSVNHQSNINVYYIVWDPWSLLSLVIGELEEGFMKKTKSNVKVVGKIELLQMLDIEDVDTPLLTVLQSLNSYHNDKNVYTVVDEFKSNGNDEIQSLLEEKNLYTTVLIQPMMTHYVRDNVPRGNEISESQYGKIFFLTEAMRTTKQVSSVLKVSQDVMEEKPTSYYLQSVVGERDVQESPNLNESAEARLQSPQVYNKVTTETKSSMMKENVASYDLKSHKSVKSIELECCIQEISEHDVLDEKVVLECFFQKFEHLGHEILGSNLPTFYECPLWPDNETEIIKRNDINFAVNLKSIFETLDKNEPNQPVTILCNQATRNILKKSLSLLSDKNHKEISVVDTNNIIEYTPFIDNPNHYPSQEYKEEVYGKFKAIQNHIFVTDIMAFRGLECKNLIILIDTSQHQGRQFLAECIARCTTNQLYMVDVTNEMDERNVDEQTLHHIIEALKAERKIDTKQVSVFGKDLSVWRTIARTQEGGANESEGSDLRHLIAWDKYAIFFFHLLHNFFIRAKLIRRLGWKVAKQ